MRVLVVEDDPKMAALIARGLREDGVAADVAGSGGDALWMAGATEYDALAAGIAAGHGDRATSERGDRRHRRCHLQLSAHGATLASR